MTIILIILALVIGILLGAFGTRQRTVKNKAPKFGSSLAYIVQINPFNDPCRQAFTAAQVQNAGDLADRNPEDFKL